jgi:hypothetical protein
MRTTVLARRYLPLAAALGVLLLIIAVFPSTAKTSTTSAAATGPVRGYSVGAGGSGGSGGTAGGAGSGASGGATATLSGGASGTSGAAGGVSGSSTSIAGAGGGPASGGGAGIAGATTSAASGGGGSVATKAAAEPAANATALSGDTTHCVDGREYSPAIDFYAPPCTPGTPGAPLPSNGGATSAGVTSNQIELVFFATDYGAVINAILQAEGLYVTTAEDQQLMAAYQSFVNTKYVLWGRKVHIDVYQSGCTAAPPDLQCLLPEMDKITATYHPFAVLWDTTVCSACYAELAKDGVIGVGGSGFTDSFSNQLAPYFYSEGESSTRTITAFTQFWCNQLSSANDPSRTVAFAGTENSLQLFNGRPRVLGVLTPNDPDNEDAVTNVLEPQLAAGCNDAAGVNEHKFFYSQDASTAAQQTVSAVSAMNTPSNPATSVLCLCDPVAPAFLYGGEKEDNYWPEQIIASDQGQDDDLVGQSYESGEACAGPPCEFDVAFGLSTQGPQLPTGKDPGYLAYDAGGGTGTPVSGLSADTAWETVNMLASLIENTGPDLTPARMQAAAPSMGMRGGGTTGMAEVGFAPGDWQWIQDARIVYFDKSAPSGYNGLAGAYVQEPGTPRYALGQYPSAPSGPAGIPKGR